MQHTVRVPCLAIYKDLVVTIADRLKTYPAYADGFKILDDSLVSMRKDDAVSLAIEQKVHDYGLDPRRTRHVHFRFNVYLPGQRIQDPLVALFSVSHQMDSKGTDKLCDLMARRHNFRIISQRSVTCASQIIGICQPYSYRVRSSCFSYLDFLVFSVFFAHLLAPP